MILFVFALMMLIVHNGDDYEDGDGEGDYGGHGGIGGGGGDDDGEGSVALMARFMQREMGECLFAFASADDQR